MFSIHFTHCKEIKVLKMKQNLEIWGRGCFRFVLTSEILLRQFKKQITLTL